jgi:hypothetical protein
VVDLGAGAREAGESQQLARAFYARPTPAAGIPRVVVPPPARLPSIPSDGAGTSGVATTGATITVASTGTTTATMDGGVQITNATRVTTPATPHATAAAAASTASADDASTASRAATKADDDKSQQDAVVEASVGGNYKILRGTGGVEYAVSGQVMVTSGSIRNDPEGAIRELTQIREAALTPPTTFQDLQLAARAALDVQRAQLELARKRYSDHATIPSKVATPDASLSATKVTA